MTAVPLWMNPPEEEEAEETRPGKATKETDMSAAEAKALGIEVR